MRNVILMIGDGMGPQQVSQAILYRQLRRQKSKPLVLERLFDEGVSGKVKTFSANSLVTDSAAASTAMACGTKTNNGMLGFDAAGKPCTSIVRLAKRHGKSAGLVSTTRFSHATPAAFAANNIFRENENEIAKQLITEGVVDVMMGGGGRHLLPEGSLFSQQPDCLGLNEQLDGKSKRNDTHNLVQEAQKNGYRFVCHKKNLNQVKTGEKVLGVFAASHFPMIQERSKIKALPTLAEMTHFSLQHLSKNEKGFFLMVEGGLIDYAGHQNDAGAQLMETLDFDDALAVSKEFVDHHPDTLLLVTADHETGGFAFSYQLPLHPLQPQHLKSGDLYQEYYLNPTPEIFALFEKQKSSFNAILQPLIGEDPKTAAPKLVEKIAKETAYILTLEEAEFVLRKPDFENLKPEDRDPFPFCDVEGSLYHADKLAAILGPQNYSIWATGHHTHTFVDLIAYGPSEHTQMAAGLHDNTDLFEMIQRVFGFDQ